MTNTKKYAELHQLLMDATYPDVYMLEQNFKKALDTGKDFSENKELNEAIKHYVEVLPVNDVYDFIAQDVAEKEEEQEFNNIVGYCYEFMEFEMFSSFNLALAFHDFYNLTDEKISNLFKEVEFEDVNFFEALETFKKSKLAKDLMIFMRSFSKSTARKVNISEGFVQAKNFNNRRNVIYKLIREAGLEEERLDFPRYDHTRNEFMIKNITRKEDKVLYNLNVNKEIKKISDFENFGMTLITV